MDWNKISTILITAFIILNVFLFVSSKDMLNTGYGPADDKEFVQEVANLLMGQNIRINTQIPATSLKSMFNSVLLTILLIT
jgi:regulatory protein YycI of two-component signal transduction system YycFG